MVASITGVYLMAIPAIALSALAWGGLICVLSGGKDRYFWLMLPALPMSAAVNVLVKRPLAMEAAQMGGITPGLRPDAPFWYLAVLLLLAPLTEEAIKVAPLLWPPARALIADGCAALYAGMWLGLGFGLGEAAFLAYGVSLNSTYTEMPWYLFTGFLWERFAVCFAHAVFSAIVVVSLRRGPGGLLLGYAIAAALHALTNLGAMLYQLELISGEAWQGYLAASLLLLAVIIRRERRSQTGSSYSAAVCPAGGASTGRRQMLRLAASCFRR